MSSEFKLDEQVYDDLTRMSAKLIGIQHAMGTCNKQKYHGVVTGYWLDNDYLGGGRHPWEISKLNMEDRDDTSL